MLHRFSSRVATRSAVAVSPSVFLGGLFALETFWRGLGPVVHGHAPWYGLLLAPAGAFALFGGGTFALIVAGAVSGERGRELHVSPWFAAGVIGAFITFIVALIASNASPDVSVWRAVEAACGWAALLFVVSAAVRLRSRARRR